MRPSAHADVNLRQLSEKKLLFSRAGWRGVLLVGTCHDEAVRGSDPINSRPGFTAMLEALETNGTKTRRMVGRELPVVLKSPRKKQGAAGITAAAPHLRSRSPQSAKDFYLLVNSAIIAPSKARHPSRRSAAIRCDPRSIVGRMVGRI
jgi:hypothetical protein